MTMDWIVTTGSTVEAALDVALDELSVTQEDVEFEVVKEPQKSLFGFRRNQAQVRARIRPMEPPAKREWRKSSKSDKHKKARKQSRNTTKRSGRTADKKGPQSSGISQSKKTAKPQRKENNTAVNDTPHETGQVPEESNIRKRTISTNSRQSNTRSINDENESPTSEPPKVRRTRKIDH